MPWIFLIATAAGTAFLYVFCVRLKTVSLEGSALVVTDRDRTTLVPLSEVERVSGSILMNPELIWVHLRHYTEFGKTIMFMPPMRFWHGFSPHPLAEELTTLAQLSGGSMQSDGRRTSA